MKTFRALSTLEKRFAYGKAFDLIIENVEQGILDIEVDDQELQKQLNIAIKETLVAPSDAVKKLVLSNPELKRDLEEISRNAATSAWYAEMSDFVIYLSPEMAEDMK